ncbi:MAG: hypothetical protein RL641_787 [Candidatus Parcubacteria bacterium]|jgi:flagellar biosynthesis protein FliP
MALSELQLQNKPKRKGFFVLLAIFILIILSAFFLSKNFKQIVQPVSQKDIQDAKLLQLMNENIPVQQLTTQQKKDLNKQMTAKTKAKPLTTEQKASLEASMDKQLQMVKQQ